jgi:hypothetical protein
VKQVTINFTRGNDVTLAFQIATSVALATARFTAKRSFGNADNDAAATKITTVGSAPDGQITTAGPPTAVVKIVLAKGDTDNFLAPPSPSQADVFTYKWDLEVFDAAGNSTTPAGGGIVVNERVRTAIG